MDREANFWGRIVEGLWRPTRVLNRIENGVLDGMPDAYFTIDGVSGWMELKAPVEPLRPDTPLFGSNHRLSISQRNWLLLHRQAGGAGFVAVETQSTVLLIGARHADSVNTRSLSQLKLLSDFHAPRPMTPAAWTGFVAALTSTETTP